MPTTTLTPTGYLVRSRQGHVVLALWGADAAEAAAEWEDRGYLVSEVARADLDS